MVKQQFEATPGLLQDVMRKQAGSVEKAVLEAVMNSVDANAETIEHDIGIDQLILEDDGKGMSEEEILKYFQKFGLKDDDVNEKEFGKFRMGRGQIFNFGVNIWHSNNNLMIVDLNNDETRVRKDLVGDIDDDEYIRRDDSHYVVDSSGLGFNLLNASSDYDGCRIEVHLYKHLENLNDTVEEIQKQTKYIPWMFDVDYLINGELHEVEFDYDFETPRAYYKVGLDAWGSGTDVYNQGAYVKSENITKTNCIIVSKEDLDVNFARNDILDTCDVYNVIKEEIKHLVADYLIDANDMTDGERVWLLEEAAGDDRMLDKIRSIALIPDTQGMYYSVDGLKGKKVTFSSSENKLAERVANRRTVVVIKRTFESAVRNLVEESGVYRFSDLVGEELGAEMREYSEDELSKKRRTNLRRAEWFIKRCGLRKEVVAGYSDEMEMWIDSDDKLVIHKSVLNWKKDRFLTEGLLKAYRYACHDGDTVEEFDEDFSFKHNLSNHFPSMAEAQHEIMIGKADIE